MCFVASIEVQFIEAMREEPHECYLSRLFPTPEVYNFLIHSFSIGYSPATESIAHTILTFPLPYFISQCKTLTTCTDVCMWQGSARTQSRLTHSLAVCLATFLQPQPIILIQILGKQGFDILNQRSNQIYTLIGAIVYSRSKYKVLAKIAVFTQTGSKEIGYTAGYPYRSLKVLSHLDMNNSRALQGVVSPDVQKEEESDQQEALHKEAK